MANQVGSQYTNNTAFLSPWMGSGFCGEKKQVRVDVNQSGLSIKFISQGSLLHSVSQILGNQFQVCKDLGATILAKTTIHLNKHGLRNLEGGLIGHVNEKTRLTHIKNTLESIQEGGLSSDLHSIVQKIVRAVASPIIPIREPLTKTSSAESSHDNKKWVYAAATAAVSVAGLAVLAYSRPLPIPAIIPQNVAVNYCHSVDTSYYAGINGCRPGDILFNAAHPLPNLFSYARSEDLYVPIANYSHSGDTSYYAGINGCRPGDILFNADHPLPNPSSLARSEDLYVPIEVNDCYSGDRSHEMINESLLSDIPFTASHSPTDLYTSPPKPPETSYQLEIKKIENIDNSVLNQKHWMCIGANCTDLKGIMIGVISLLATLVIGGIALKVKNEEHVKPNNEEDLDSTPALIPKPLDTKKVLAFHKIFSNFHNYVLHNLLAQKSIDTSIDIELLLKRNIENNQRSPLGLTRASLPPSELGKLETLAIQPHAQMEPEQEREPDQKNEEKSFSSLQKVTNITRFKDLYTEINPDCRRKYKRALKSFLDLSPEQQKSKLNAMAVQEEKMHPRIEV